ncbi:DUF4344 domain-containing metallopeptidase [Roseibium sp. MMSF_3412]|uniref:DUF4344 domain-containing metallopeptidase n=1 Tax=Roseibium sp. MMSF_3412 TaxID=3046712 RepID=UPI00273E288A|nr:DUF4344 domain-containing metallopeptidase [Roseibium sp. MMSF_3412]
MQILHPLLSVICLTFALTLGPFQTDKASADDAGRFEGLQSDLQALTEEERAEFFDFVAGNTVFVTYHEAGHMLVSELELPVLAQEEDAVDNLATVSMLAADTDDMDVYLTHAMTGWFLMSEEDYDALVFYGEHDLDQQRGYRMLCLMVGADDDAFLDLAQELDLPEDRIESCAVDYEQAADSWEYVTDPFVREEDTAAGRIKVIHETAPKNLGFLAAFLKETKILETIAEELDTLYDLPENVTFRSAACGEDNAFWDADTREVIICHELLGGFAELYLDLISDDG